MYTILAINPGSTSTKVAIYQDDKAVRELTLRHSTEELAPFAGVLDQFDFRKQIILDAMKEAGVTLSDIDAVIGLSLIHIFLRCEAYRFPHLLYLDEPFGRFVPLLASR